MNSPGLPGERSAENTMSPTPLVESMVGESAGFQMIGTMVRVMTFHSEFNSNGITGWMLRTSCVPFSGPTLKLVLLWNGTLIRLAIGFCASLASSSADSSACAGAVAAIAIANAAAASHRGAVLVVMYRSISLHGQ